MIIIWTLAVLLVAGALWFALARLLRTGGRIHPAAQKLALISNFQRQLTELDAGLANGTLTREHYERSRAELEKRLGEETKGGAAKRAWFTTSGPRRLLLPVIIGLFVTLLAIGAYFLMVAPQVLVAKAPATATEGANAHRMTQEQLQVTVARLAERLQNSPHDADGWATLGRSYSLLQRFDDGAAAFAKAAALQPQDAQLLADYADAVAMAQGKRFDGKPAELIQSALKIDPNNMKALTLAGSAAFDAKAYDQAIAFWQQLLQQVPPEAEMARTLKTNIADAKQRGGRVPPVAEIRAGKKTQVAVTREADVVHATIKGKVRLIAELATKASPTDTVFVFARAADGAAMPLAVIKGQVKDLPMNFTLDDTMAISPDAKLSKFQLVDVGARISKSGSVTTQRGDLVSPIVRTTVGGPDVEVPIQGLVR